MILFVKLNIYEKSVIILCMKIGIIDVGGGMRDIFGAGVFDVAMPRKQHYI